MLVGLCCYVNLDKVFVWLVSWVGLLWFLESINLFFFLFSLVFKTIEHLSVHERKEDILHNRADIMSMQWYLNVFVNTDNSPLNEGNSTIFIYNFPIYFYDLLYLANI